MKTIKSFYDEIIKNGILESTWYKTAPTELKKYAKIKVIGIEERKFRSIMGTSQIRPALKAICTIGDETQEFILLLDGTHNVEQL